MGLTGDFATLAKMRGHLAKMPEAAARVAQESAPLFAARIQESFAKEQSPNGKRWKRDKAKTYARGTQSILIRTGRYYNSFATAAIGAGIKISRDAEYLRYKMGRNRNPFPSSSTKLPGPWSQELARKCREVIAALARGQ